MFVVGEITDNTPVGDIIFTMKSLGYEDLVSYIRENESRPVRFAFAEAAKVGRLDLLKWMKIRSDRYDKNTFANAVFSGNIEILEWLKEIRFHGMN